MPLAGTVSDQLTEIAELPKTQPARITDAFSMSAAGISDQTEYGTFRRDPYMAPDSPEYKQYTVLRTIQVKFDSNVQALLDLDPMERFYYAVDTTEGPLMAKMNNIVYNIPLGFTGKTMLAPGASNRFHMPFEIPEALSGVSSRLIGDISDGSLDIPVTSGSPAKTSSMGLKFSHEYFDLTINSLARSPFSNSYVILDVTVSDKRTVLVRQVWTAYWRSRIKMHRMTAGTSSHTAAHPNTCTGSTADGLSSTVRPGAASWNSPSVPIRLAGMCCVLPTSRIWQ